MPAVLSGKHLIAVAQCLHELGRPASAAELGPELLGTGRIFSAERLIQESPHSRICALHEQTLKLDHDLNDAVGGRRAFGRQNAGLLKSG